MQTPPVQNPSPWADHPQDRHPQADTPRQTPPGRHPQADTRQTADGTHPTGMHIFVNVAAKIAPQKAATKVTPNEPSINIVDFIQ